MEIDDYIVASDQKLIEFVLEGDSAAFEYLFNRYRDAIYMLYIQRTVGNTDDSDDLLQETFVKVYLNLHRYNPDFTFGQWVYAIARNTFIDYVRRRRSDTISIDVATDSDYGCASLGGLNPEEKMIIAQNRVQLDKFIAMMTPRYRQLIDLRFFREFSYDEIAAELQLPLGTVKTQIHRAREQLCKFILNSNETIL